MPIPFNHKSLHRRLLKRFLRQRRRELSLARAAFRPHSLLLSTIFDAGTNHNGAASQQPQGG
jgi:hypothetical protein